VHGKRKIIGLALGVIAAGAIGAGQTAQAGPKSCTKTGERAEHLEPVSAGKSYSGTGVYFFNYDFAHPTCERATNAEWPIQLLFTDNAYKRKIESQLDGLFKFGGIFASPEAARIDDGNGWFWGTDGGKKTLPFSIETHDDHYRLYAYSNVGEHSYSMQLGFFVIGTIHRDYNEFAGATKASYGHSEEAEYDLDQYVAEQIEKKKLDWEVFPFDEEYALGNKQNGEEGNHQWESSGFPTLFEVKE
jgi:hypothetical protein